MEHNIEQVEVKEINDEMVSIRFRCCGDASTDSWCTVSLKLTQDELSEAVAAHQTRMATNHEHKIKFREGTHHVHQAIKNNKVKI